MTFTTKNMNMARESKSINFVTLINKMCYSFKTSIISYILGMASAIFAFCTRQVVLGCLILAYAQMQLSEMMVWYGIDTKKPEWNKKGTTFGKYLLATHNFAIGMGILLSIIFISKQSFKLTDFIPIVVGALFFVCVVVFAYLPRQYPDMTFPEKDTCNKCQNPENRLKWPFPHGWYIFSYLISVVLMFFWIKPQGSKFIFLTFFSLSFLIAALVYPKTVGSVWCWSTSFIAPAIVLINYYFIRNQPNSVLLV